MVPVNLTFKLLRSFSCSPCSCNWPSLTLIWSFKRSIISRSRDLLPALLSIRLVLLTGGNEWLLDWLTTVDELFSGETSPFSGWLSDLFPIVIKGSSNRSEEHT